MLSCVADAAARLNEEDEVPEKLGLRLSLDGFAWFVLPKEFKLVTERVLKAEPFWDGDVPAKARLTTFEILS